MTTPRRLPVTRALKQLLIENMPTLAVEVDDAPIDPDTETVAPLPYIVIYSIPGGAYVRDGFCGGTTRASFPYQITVFGSRSDQVQGALDDIRHIISGRDSSGDFAYPMEITGHSVMDRDSVGPAGRIDRDGKIFSSNEDYVITVTTV